MAHDFPKVELDEKRAENGEIKYFVTKDSVTYDAIFPEPVEDKSTERGYFVDNAGVKQRLFLIDLSGAGVFFSKDRKMKSGLWTYNALRTTGGHGGGACDVMIRDGGVIFNYRASTKVFEIYCLPADDPRMQDNTYGKTKIKLIEVPTPIIDEPTTVRVVPLGTRTALPVSSGPASPTRTPSRQSLNIKFWLGLVAAAGVVALLAMTLGVIATAVIASGAGILLGAGFFMKEHPVRRVPPVAAEPTGHRITT